MNRTNEGRTMVDRVRWGILGTGKIARILAGAVRHSRHGELVVVGSRDHQRARSFAAEVGATRSGSYEQLVHDPDVDVVYVGTHHPLHKRWSVAAAEAGKHVLCEKPIALRHADAADIVEAARRYNVFLLEAFAYRCHPQTQRVVDLVREGRIGQVRMIDAAFGYDAGPIPTNYLLKLPLGGGSLLDVGCYTTSMAHLIAAASAGMPVAHIVDVVAAGRIGPTGVDHSSAATLLFEPGDVLARVACSIESMLDNAVRIYGSRGQITVPSPWLPGRIGPPAQIVVESRRAPEVIDTPVQADVYTIEVETVNASIRKGERSPTVMTWEESLANMITLDRWRATIGVRYDGDENQ